MFDLLGQLLAMAIKDGIFAADFKSLDDIYWHKIPEHRVGMQLKIKRKKLDIPVFREPEKTSTGWRTSNSIPLKASTWSRILIHLGILAALAYSLTQYVFRRMVINVLNSQYALYSPLIFNLCLNDLTCIAKFFISTYRINTTKH